MSEFDYAPIKELIISGNLGEGANDVWELMDHARDLESKLAAATRPAPAPVKRASRGSSVGARSAGKFEGVSTLDENVPAPEVNANNPFN